MHDRSRRTVLSIAGVGLAGAALMLSACSEQADVQRAVGQGAQGALARRPTQGTRLPRSLEESANLVQLAPGLTGAVPAIAPRAAGLPVSEAPTAQPDGEGVRFRPDGNHQDIATARGGDRLGVAWHDSGEGMWFASTDARGQAVRAPVQLRAVVSDEEGLSAPAVVAAGDAFGVAWVDAENGRVRFQMVGADGVPRGASTIVHEGLTDPRAARLAYNGHEFGLAAQLGEGVYFTRVDAQGRRLDGGRLFAEGERVDAVDELRWDGRAYAVRFAVSSDGRVEHREQSVTPSRSIAFRLTHQRPAPLFL